MAAPLDPEPTAMEADPGGEVRRVLRIGVALVALSVVAQTAGHLTNLVFLDREIDALDIKSERSLWTWASTAAAAIAAAALGLVAIVRRTMTLRLFTLAGLLAFLSADDMVALHEQIDVPQLGPVPHASRLVWPLIWSPILGLTLLLLLLLGRSAMPPIRRVLLIGLACLVTAIALEVTSPVLFAAGMGTGTPVFEAEEIVEENLELLGIGLIATSASALLVAELRRRPG
jgi:hypothetical protein